MVCPPSRGIVSPFLPLRPHMCACVGWCVRLPEVLSPLVSSPHMCASVGWCVRLPEILSPHASPCLSLSPHMCACVGWCVRLPEFLSPLVSDIKPIWGILEKWPRIKPVLKKIWLSFFLENTSVVSRESFIFTSSTFTFHLLRKVSHESFVFTSSTVRFWGKSRRGAAISDAALFYSVLCNSVSADRTVVAASRLLGATAACVILFSFAAKHRNS